MSVEVSIKCGNVIDEPSDLLLLKYAGGFHGADQDVATRLIRGRICTEDEISPAEGDLAIVDARGEIRPGRVMFLGTATLRGFRYKQMRQFARQAIDALSAQSFPVRTLTTTVHGAGYGLDIEESLQAMISGFQQGIAAGGAPQLEKITFVELSPRRFEMLSAILEDVEPIPRPAKSSIRERSVPSDTVPSPELNAKACVFVAMPFQEDFEDVYQFGIYSAVRACGFVCEKVDESAFAGSIIDRITDGIRRAEFVIADLTHEKPNVYLEVGYAWGLGRPVILIAREGQRLHFDLSHHKCIFYRTIGKLAKDLEQTIREFAAADRVQTM